MTRNTKMVPVHEMPFQFTDGGRMESGSFKRQFAGDCVTRAIVIAEGIDYKLVYREFSRRMKMRYGRGGASNGVADAVWRPMLTDAGYKRVFDTYRSTGWRTPLPSMEIPVRGTFVLRVRHRNGRSGHLFTIRDGVIMDTYNPALSRREYEVFEVYEKPARSTLSGQIRDAKRPAKPKKERKVAKNASTNKDHIKVGKAWREIDPDAFKRWGKEAGTWSRAAAGAYLQETDPDQYASLLAR